MVCIDFAGSVTCEIIPTLAILLPDRWTKHGDMQSNKMLIAGEATLPNMIVQIILRHSAPLIIPINPIIPILQAHQTSLHATQKTPEGLL